MPTETLPAPTCIACGHPVDDGFRVHPTCIVGLGTFRPEHAPDDWAVRPIRRAPELLEVEYAGYVSRAEMFRRRAVRAEAALVALIARLDAGGRPADLLADLGVILDETRSDLPRAGGGT